MLEIVDTTRFIRYAAAYSPPATLPRNAWIRTASMFARRTAPALEAENALPTLSVSRIPRRSKCSRAQRRRRAKYESGNQATATTRATSARAVGPAPPIAATIVAALRRNVCNIVRAPTARARSSAMRIETNERLIALSANEIANAMTATCIPPS